MVERTSTGNAPWTLVEANDKNYARVKILRTLCQRLEAELSGLPLATPGATKKVDAKHGKNGKDSKLDKAQPSMVADSAPLLSSVSAHKAKPDNSKPKKVKN